MSTNQQRQHDLKNPFEAPVAEKDVKKDISKRLKTVPGLWYYMPVQSAYGVHGIPDYVACVPLTITEDMVGLRIGVFAAIEAKRPGKDATSVQSDVHDAIRAADGVVTVINRNDDDGGQFLEWLRQVTRRVKEVL